MHKKRCTFYFDNITSECLWKGSLHLPDIDKNILNKNFCENINAVQKYNLQAVIKIKSNQTTNLILTCKVSDFKPTYFNNPTNGYLNIESLSAKITSLRKILSKAPIDILCLDQTKINSGFPDAPFKINGYQYSPIRRDGNSKDGGKILSKFFHQAGYYRKKTYRN